MPHIIPQDYASVGHISGGWASCKSDFGQGDQSLCPVTDLQVTFFSGEFFENHPESVFLFHWVGLSW